MNSQQEYHLKAGLLYKLNYATVTKVLNHENSPFKRDIFHKFSFSDHKDSSELSCIFEGLVRLIQVHDLKRRNSHKFTSQ